jgi:hypothetical protein
MEPLLGVLVGEGESCARTLERRCRQGRAPADLCGNYRSGGGGSCVRESDSEKPELLLTKARDERSIRQFMEKLIGRELMPEELAELHERCEEAGLPPTSC